MMFSHFPGRFAGRLAIASAALLVLPLASLPTEAGDKGRPTWQAVDAEVPVGKGVRVAVRLVDAGAKPIVTGISVTSTRLDMGPDGMAMMVAPLRPIAGTEPGVFAFDTDLIMAGRWALQIRATVAGQTEPVSGTVIFTAVEKRSDTPTGQMLDQSGHAAAGHDHAAHAGHGPSPSSAGNAGTRRILYYRNPMGLADISPVPKKDTMGMDYIPVYEDDTAGPPGTVRIAPEKIQRAGVRTAPVTRQRLSRTIRGVGTVMADEGRVSALTVKFEGFIEELFVPVTGADVRLGQPLARVWIASNDILQKQSDFLVALRGGSGRAGDIERTANNLRLFGIPDQVIAEIRRSGAPARSIVLNASANGTVMQKPAVNGMRFAPGDMLFKVVDLSSVWVMAQIAERDLGLLRVGQAARIALNAEPDRTVDGRIEFIYPDLDMATRTATVRMVVANADRRLKIGQYADVSIDAAVGNGPVIAVPVSAVIDSGTRRVGLVARDGGVFEPRSLVLGARGDGLVEVREGLSEGEHIVVKGNFLIDAESNLRAALAAFSGAGTAP
jgi:Cu(I)/Ag(I) efflux system membrane fusion protein